MKSVRSRACVHSFLYELLRSLLNVNSALSALFALCRALLLVEAYSSSALQLLTLPRLYIDLFFSQFIASARLPHILIVENIRHTLFARTHTMTSCVR